MEKRKKKKAKNNIQSNHTGCHLKASSSPGFLSSELFIASNERASKASRLGRTKRVEAEKDKKT